MKNIMQASFAYVAYKSAALFQSIKSVKYRAISVLCAGAVVLSALSLSQIVAVATPSPIILDLATAPVNITESGTYVITQSNNITDNTITVSADCTVRLSGVNVFVLNSPDRDYSDVKSPFDITNAYGVTIELVDGTVNTFASKRYNTYPCGSGKAGIHVPQGANLIIEGNTGILNAYGASGYCHDDGHARGGGGAGIGGNADFSRTDGNNAENSGAITIYGGFINAVGGNGEGYWGSGGAGIGGGGANYNCNSGGFSPIVIHDCTVNATGGFAAENIGANQAPAIGYGGYFIGSAGTVNSVNISDCKLTAVGGYNIIPNLTAMPSPTYCYVSENADGSSSSLADNISDLSGKTFFSTDSICYVPAVSQTCTTPGSIAHWRSIYTHDLFSDPLGHNTITPESVVIPVSHTTMHHSAKAKTCTTDGNTEYWSCDDCGKIFSDENATNEITDNSYIIPKSHKLTHHAAVAKTCTTDGNIEYWSCDDCGKIFSDASATTQIAIADTVISHSHELTRHAAVAKTCTTDGNIEYWSCDDCDKRFSDENATNEITDNSYIIPKSHKLTHHAAVAKTCTTDGNIEYWSCDDCQKKFADENANKEITLTSTIVKKTGHIWDDGVITTEPTTTSDGLKTYTCKECGETKNETLPKLIEEPSPKTGDSSNIRTVIIITAVLGVLLAATILFKVKFAKEHYETETNSETQNHSN